MTSPQRRQEIIDALRRGTVPRQGLDAFAVGLERFERAIGDEMDTVGRGGAVFKALCGEYGSGKTFFARWLEERAKRLGFATAEVQISETETPLHRLETVYRRLMERLSTSAQPDGALRAVIDGWFFALEQDVLAEGNVAESDGAALVERSTALMEQRLAGITRTAPAFAAALRAYREATAGANPAIADGMLAWLGGEPNVGAEVKRFARIKGDVDHFGALSFLQGLLVVLRDSGHPGLLVVLDEVETLQRVRGDVREKGLNAIRQLIDEVDAGRFPGLYLLITGTPAFFDGPQGIQRLPPLAQRLHVDFATEARFDNPRAVQIRLPGFTPERLEEVGRKVRDLYAEHAPAAERIRAAVDDAYVAALAGAVTGNLGGRVGVAPRVFLKKLVSDVLDRVDQFADFDPRRHYALTIDDAELTAVERRARGAATPDDIALDL
ncbi:MAG TPA: BREX system ATP-binding protein BrxD [Longimicrobiales bacterium]|nr:BREX system ATP-binding protein BrxD [Longimicrobiales bacterium]